MAAPSPAPSLCTFRPPDRWHSNYVSIPIDGNWHLVTGMQVFAAAKPTVHRWGAITCVNNNLAAEYNRKVAAKLHTVRRR